MAVPHCQMFIVNMLHWHISRFPPGHRENYILLKFHFIRLPILAPLICLHQWESCLEHGLSVKDQLLKLLKDIICLISSGHISHSQWNMVLTKSCRKGAWCEYILPSDHCSSLEIHLNELSWFAGFILTYHACHTLNIWHGLFDMIFKLFTLPWFG